MMRCVLESNDLFSVMRSTCNAPHFVFTAYSILTCVFNTKIYLDLEMVLIYFCRIMKLEIIKIVKFLSNVLSFSKRLHIFSLKFCRNCHFITTQGQLNSTDTSHFSPLRFFIFKNSILH